VNTIVLRHKLEEVPIKRHGTIADAFAIGLEKRRKGIIASLAIFREPLAMEYEGEMKYTKTLSLATPGRKMDVREFYLALHERQCHPASMNEDVAYLFMLMHHHVEAGPILHLGTILRSESCEAQKEQRLLTREDGGGRLVDFYYPQTSIEPNCSVIVREDGRRH